jgi:hypothetical protein
MDVNQHPFSLVAVPAEKTNKTRSVKEPHHEPMNHGNDYRPLVHGQYIFEVS